MRRRAGLTLLAAAVAAAVPTGSPAQTPPTVTVRASRNGFQPAHVSLRRGETTHLVLTSADGDHCFAVDDLRIEKRIVAGRETRFDITPEKAGVFPFHCCVETGDAAKSERGQLTVAE